MKLELIKVKPWKVIEKDPFPDWPGNRDSAIADFNTEEEAMVYIVKMYLDGPLK